MNVKKETLPLETRNRWNAFAGKLSGEVITAESRATQKKKAEEKHPNALGIAKKNGRMYSFKTTTFSLIN
jgi:hypothetical protein